MLRLDAGEPTLVTDFGAVDNDVERWSNGERDWSDEGRYDDALSAGCEDLVRDYADSLCDGKRGCSLAPAMERVSVKKLCCGVMQRALWEICTGTESLPAHLRREAFNCSEDRIVEHCRDALVALLGEIIHLGDNVEHGHLSCWPKSEFID